MSQLTNCELEPDFYELSKIYYVRIWFQYIIIKTSLLETQSCIFSSDTVSCHHAYDNWSDSQLETYVPGLTSASVRTGLQGWGPEWMGVTRLEDERGLVE